MSKVDNPARRDKACLVSTMISFLLTLLFSFASLFLAFQTVYHSYQPQQQPLQQAVWAYLDDPDRVLINNRQLTVAERRHLLSVKHWLVKVKQISWFFMPWLLLLLLLPCSRLLQRSLKYTQVFLVATLFSLLLYLGFNFIQGFIYLHTVLFPQGNWVFSEHSALIQAFPLSYFQTFAGLWLLVCVSLCLLYVVIYRYNIKPDSST